MMRIGSVLFVVLTIIRNTKLQQQHPPVFRTFLIPTAMPQSHLISTHSRNDPRSTTLQQHKQQKHQSNGILHGFIPQRKLSSSAVGSVSLAATARRHGEVIPRNNISVIETEHISVIDSNTDNGLLLASKIQTNLPSRRVLLQRRILTRRKQRRRQNVSNRHVIRPVTTTVREIPKSKQLTLLKTTLIPDIFMKNGSRQRNIHFNTRLVGLAPSSVHSRPIPIKSGPRKQITAITTRNSTSVTVTSVPFIIPFITESREILSPVRRTRIFERPAKMRSINNAHNAQIISNVNSAPNSDVQGKFTVPRTFVPVEQKDDVAQPSPPAEKIIQNVSTPFNTSAITTSQSEDTLTDEIIVERVQSIRPSDTTELPADTVDHSGSESVERRISSDRATEELFSIESKASLTKQIINSNSDSSESSESKEIQENSINPSLNKGSGPVPPAPQTGGTRKQPADLPPGFLPPNDAVIAQLNSAQNFLAVAEAMQLKRQFKGD